MCLEFIRKINRLQCLLRHRKTTCQVFVVSNQSSPTGIAVHCRTESMKLLTGAKTLETVVSICKVQYSIPTSRFGTKFLDINKKDRHLFASKTDA